MKKKIQLMTHSVIGYPSLDETVHFARIMEQAGADYLELQIPFSDPLADGPTIMKACDYALKSGTTVVKSLETIRTITAQVSIPVYVMCYYNTAYTYGTEKFAKKIKNIGGSGLIIPDIPPDEEYNERYSEFCNQYDVENIRVLSPSSTIDRIKKNISVASGFIYYVARHGTTGANQTLDMTSIKKIRTIRKYTNLPIAVGFGISKKVHMKTLQDYADIAVVGSAIIDVINKGKDYEKDINSIKKPRQHTIYFR
ncbi:tryptophan synthase subunit alpha, partial [Candidatus Roizmanbacteria bacterium]|nr:tryptophan synthase subunit alpha [Candidatus Roizmanbacteria bacterium]